MANLTRKGRTIVVPDDAVDHYIERGWTSPEMFPDGVPLELPDGEPSDKWTNPQLVAYAGVHGIDLAGATKKADLLVAVLPG